MGSTVSPRTATVPKPQFSLRWLMIFVTLLAILLGVILYAPDFIAAPVLAIVLLALPGVMLAAVHRRWVGGYGAAFCIGALCAVAACLGIAVFRARLIFQWGDWRDQITTSVYHEVTLLLRATALMELVAVPLLGAIFVAVRWRMLLADEGEDWAAASSDFMAESFEEESSDAGGSARRLERGGR
jgi:hypothetical protein